MTIQHYVRVLFLMALYNHLTKDITICHNDEKITLYEFIVKKEIYMKEKMDLKLC